jgi:hypothetical protein
MLSQQKVLTYIKDGLGFPLMHLEWSDDKIIEYFTEHTLNEFSHYQPDINRMGLNLLLEANKVAGRSNEWYLNEPKGREIFNIVDIYFSMGNEILLGHPPMGVLSHGELGEWALAVSTSMTTKMFSDYDYTFEFMHPNKVRISPVSSNESTVTVEYERMHATDLGTIPNELQFYFKQLAMADIMIAIGRIRKRYGGNMRTPFGEIPLEAEIYDEGKELKREIKEKLENTLITNVVIDHG